MNVQFSPIRKQMHIVRANKTTMAPETAGAAAPISVLGFMTMPTSGTLATGSSFRASEARDVSLFGFVGQIVDIFPILPLAHALVVMFATILLAHPMWVAD